MERGHYCPHECRFDAKDMDNSVIEQLSPKTALRTGMSALQLLFLTFRNPQYKIPN